MEFVASKCSGIAESSPGRINIGRIGVSSLTEVEKLSELERALDDKTAEVDETTCSNTTETLAEVR